MNDGKYKFLFVSLTGLISDIAWQVVKEGHEVRYFIGSESERDIADGFVPKTADWKADVDWADVIVFDDTLGFGAEAEALRARGKRVVGGSGYTDRLEDDRSFGQEELKQAGVAILPYQEFDNFAEAIRFVRANPERYVIKPSGEAQNVKRRLLVGEEEDGEDVVRMLEAYGKAFAEEIKVLLQRQAVRHPDQRQLRAQEALSRQHWAQHGGDGHGDVLEPAQQTVQRHPAEDGAGAGARGLRGGH